MRDGRSGAGGGRCRLVGVGRHQRELLPEPRTDRVQQANAEALPGAPLWFANNKDTIDTAGAGIKHRASDKLDIGADYTMSRSTGEISIKDATVGFPDLKSRLDSAKLYATYRLKEKLSLHLAYWYENYWTEDWTLDDVTPTTIGNVLAFGQGSPSYHVNVISLSARYQF